MSFYGKQWIEAVDQKVYTDEVLQEMRFSKKDLQDPKTIEKILKRKEAFENINKYTGWLFAILTAAGTIAGGIVSIELVAPAFLVLGIVSVYLNEALKSMPLKNFEKNNKKYLDSIDKLIKKMEDNIKNPKASDKVKAESKKVLANCKKVLEEIENKKKLEEQKEFMKNVDFVSMVYEDYLVKFLKDPTSFDGAGDGIGFEDCMNIAKTLKIPESIIMKKIEKITEIINLDDYSILIDMDLLDREKDYILVDITDDSAYFYDPDTKKLYEADYKRLYTIKPYEAAVPIPIYDKKVIEEADRQLGYYLITECPEQVKKKEFPIKLR